MDSNTDDRDPEVPPDVPPDELQEALQWLEELTGPSSATPAAEAAIDSPFHGLVDDGAGDLPDWLREAPKEPVEPRLADEGEFESRMDWLAKMAERESIEELPTLEWRNLSGAPQPPATGDAAQLADDTLPPTFPPELLPVEATPPQPLTAEAVLLVPDELADDVAPVAAPEDEAPAAPLPDEEPVMALEATPITPEALLDTLPPDEELPSIDDLDAAMAWIEELAASQDAPIEDVPSVADRALASKLLMEAGLSSEGLHMRMPGDELALGDLSLLEGNTPVNAFVAAEDFADTIVLVETMAADQGRPLPPDYPTVEPPVAAEDSFDEVMASLDRAQAAMPQTPDATEVSYEEAMAFLDALAADQEPLGAQTQPLERVDAATDTVRFVTDELRPEEALLAESTGEQPPWLSDDAEPEVAQASVEDAAATELNAIEPEAAWPTEPERAAAPEVDWVASVVTDVTASDVALPVELAAADALDEAPASDWLAETAEADVALAPGDAPWLAGSVEEGATVEVEPEADLIAPNDALPAVEAARPALAAAGAVAANGDIIVSLEETLRAIDALALPEGQTLAEFDTSLQQHGATVTRRDLPAAVEWLELALGISVPTTPPTPQWSDDELISQMPDDPDAVLAWLEQLAEEDTVDSSPQLSPAAETLPGTTPATETPAFAPAERAAGAAEPLIDELSEADLQNMPEDPDAVMAWLEGLAGGRREPVSAVPPIAPAPPEAIVPPTLPTPPTSPTVDQASPATSSRSRRRRGRKTQPVIAPVEAAVEPPAVGTDAPIWETASNVTPETVLPVEATDAPIWEVTADATDIASTVATPVETADALTWEETADLAAPDVTIEVAEPTGSAESIEPALAESVDVAPTGEAAMDAPAVTWSEEALSALPLPEATDEPPVAPAAPLPAQPRRRGRKPKVAPVDVAEAVETTGTAVEETAGAVEATVEQAGDMAEPLPQPPQETEQAPPPAKPASWVDLLKPLK